MHASRFGQALPGNRFKYSTRLPSGAWVERDKYSTTAGKAAILMLNINMNFQDLRPGRFAQSEITCEMTPSKFLRTDLHKWRHF